MVRGSETDGNLGSQAWLVITNQNFQTFNLYICTELILNWSVYELVPTSKIDKICKEYFYEVLIVVGIYFTITLNKRLSL